MICPNYQYILLKNFLYFTIELQLLTVPGPNVAFYCFEKLSFKNITVDMFFKN